MLQVRGDPDLAQEAITAEGGGEFRMQDLEGDGPIVLDVVREEDGGHATPAELTLDRVGTGQPIVEDRAEIGHGGKLVTARDNDDHREVSGRGESQGDGDDQPGGVAAVRLLHLDLLDLG